jgi:hypothetical protein
VEQTLHHQYICGSEPVNKMGKVWLCDVFLGMGGLLAAGEKPLLVEQIAGEAHDLIMAPA